MGRGDRNGRDFLVLEGRGRAGVEEEEEKQVEGGSSLADL